MAPKVNQKKIGTMPQKISGAFATLKKQGRFYRAPFIFFSGCRLNGGLSQYHIRISNFFAQKLAHNGNIYDGQNENLNTITLNKSCNFHSACLNLCRSNKLYVLLRVKTKLGIVCINPQPCMCSVQKWNHAYCKA